MNDFSQSSVILSLSRLRSLCLSVLHLQLLVIRRTLSASFHLFLSIVLFLTSFLNVIKLSSHLLRFPPSVLLSVILCSSKSSTLVMCPNCFNFIFRIFVPKDKSNLFSLSTSLFLTVQQVRHDSPRI